VARSSVQAGATLMLCALILVRAIRCSLPRAHPRILAAGGARLRRTIHIE
jgi:hypothetical protein